MNLILMNAGQTELTNLLSSGQTVQIDSFTVSAQAGITLDPNGIGVPTGALVYQGTTSQIKYSLTSPHEITFIIYLEDDIGNFPVGNIIIYLQSNISGAPPVPFLWVSLDNATNKSESDLPNYVIGNRLLIHCAIWFPYITNAIDLSNLEPFMVQLESFSDESFVPNVFVGEYDQYVIQTHSLYDAATMIIKDNKHGLWWAFAFSQSLNDPEFGKITGGIAGDGAPYGSSSQIVYYDGNTFTIDNSQFTVLDGGSNWVAPNQPAIDAGSF